MKKVINVYVMAAMAAAVMVSCNNVKSDGITFKKVEISNVYKLDKKLGDKSLGYEITVDMDFLQTSDAEKKEVCGKINKSIMDEFVPQRSGDDEEAAVRKYMEEKIEAYRSDVADVYKEEILESKKHLDDYSYASFNHNTHLKGRASYGFEGIINYSMTENSYSGGAHPVSYTTMMCFSIDNGERIHLEDVFRDDCDEELTELLIGRLVEVKGASSVEELKEKGFLVLADMFVSDNFFLEADSITFFYNQYDIAPYSEGTTSLSLSYKDMKGLLR